MTFPSKTAKGSLGGLLDGVQTTAGQVRSLALQARNAMAAGDVSGNQMVQLHSVFVLARNLFNDALVNADLVQYAKDQFSDPAFDVTTEFNAMTAALDDVVAWIEASFPQDAGGWLLKDQWDSALGGVAVRSFTSAQTADLRTKLTALAATID